MTEHDSTEPQPETAQIPARRGTGRPTRKTNTSAERVVTLVDAQFWMWLTNEDAPGRGAVEAQSELMGLLRQQGCHQARLLWYSDQDSDRDGFGLQVRLVPSQKQDMGVGLLRAMAQDLQGMAENGGIDRVLLVSDDDRLLLAVDHAQRCGLMVDMLVDADSQDLKALRVDEPGWASLLLQADRLLVLGSPDTRTRSHRPRNGVSEPRPRREPPSAEASCIIEDEILQWWDDEAPEQRDVWRQEVQAARGIPQELDRQLLLRISRRLGQALSPAEKSAMRHQVRQQ
ncbi:MAG: hypothetical protein EBR46_09240, partial [Betaproteobacteria bacterium]|nr:hypothetical protein [Betaproteobacteria bacterium]